MTQSEFESDDSNVCGAQRSPESWKASAAGGLQTGHSQDNKGMKVCSQCSVCQPGLPPSTSHAISEGFLSYDVALYLKHSL